MFSPKRRRFQGRVSTHCSGNVVVFAYGSHMSKLIPPVDGCRAISSTPAVAQQWAPLNFKSKMGTHLARARSIPVSGCHLLADLERNSERISCKKARNTLSWFVKLVTELLSDLCAIESVSGEVTATFL